MMLRNTSLISQARDCEYMVSDCRTVQLFLRCNLQIQCVFGRYDTRRTLHGLLGGRT
jgi:hypothetical protein